MELASVALLKDKLSRKIFFLRYWPLRFGHIASLLWYNVTKPQEAGKSGSNSLELILIFVILFVTIVTINKSQITDPNIVPYLI